MTTGTSYQHDLYEVLGLQDRQAELSPQDLRTAYKRALLKHHPDKHGVREVPAAWSIDQISLAYTILSDPALRTEYDAAVRQSVESLPTKFKIFHTGLDTYDLDDLEYHEASSTWTRQCRCGAGGGFLVTEDELENHLEYGELITGCRGCSLWMKVLFSSDE